MLKKSVLYLALVFGVLWACNTQKQPAARVQLIPIIDEANKKDWGFSEYFDSVEVVKLQTTQECLIGEISGLKYVNGKFYILDCISHSVFVFDNKGVFLWKIHAYGRGSREYNRLTAFDVNPINFELSIYANYPQKLMQYDSTGTFIREKPIGWNVNAIAVENNQLVLHSANQLNIINKERVAPQLIIQDLQYDTLYTYLPARSENNNYSAYVFQHGESFHRYNQELLMYMPFDNNIYRIRNNKPEAKYTIDVDKFTPPYNLTLEELIDSDYAHGLNTFWENDYFCYFQITIKQRHVEVLFDKRNFNVCKGHWRDNMGGYSPRVITANNNFMLCYTQPMHLFSNAKYWKEKGGQPNHPVCKLIEGMNDDDNYVILLYKFKKL